MVRTDDAGQWTLDAGPSAPYYKLTGELKTAFAHTKGIIGGATICFCAQPTSITM